MLTGVQAGGLSPALQHDEVFKSEATYFTTFGGGKGYSAPRTSSKGGDFGGKVKGGMIRGPGTPDHTADGRQAHTEKPIPTHTPRSVQYCPATLCNISSGIFKQTHGIQCHLFMLLTGGYIFSQRKVCPHPDLSYFCVSQESREKPGAVRQAALFLGTEFSRSNPGNLRSPRWGLWSIGFTGAVIFL